MSQAIKPIDQFRSQLAHKDTYQQILNYFGGDEEITKKFVSAGVHVVRKTPELLNCERNSLMEALITCADLKMFPSSASGEAFIIPYKKKATFQLGYQGIITLFYRAGVDAITSKIVYEKDTFEYEEGLDRKLIHKPHLGKDKGKPIAVYAIADLNGTRLFHVMGEDEVMEFKNFSQSAGSSFSPWNKNDPELWMWRKTCIKQLGKVLPKNETIAKAIDRDNQDSTVSQDRKRLDTAQLKEESGATVGAITKDPHGDKKETGKKEGTKTESIPGIASNNTGEETIEA